VTATEEDEIDGIRHELDDLYPDRWALLFALGFALWLWLEAAPFAPEILLPSGLVAYAACAWTLGLVDPGLLRRLEAPPAGT
jgi:hypothetical protein